MLGRVILADAVAALTEEGQRRCAYGLAVCVCDSDVVRCETQYAFLKYLRARLGLDGDKAVDNAALNKTILNYAILNGALELLPQSWASVAITSMQIKMVYRIGKAHGHELDQGHIREFLATVGVGMTSQYLEQFGRKLVGGLLGGFLGKTGKKPGGQPPVWRFYLRQPMRLDNWPNATMLGVAK